MKEILETLATNVVNYTLSLCDKSKAQLSQAEIIRIFYSMFRDIILKFLSSTKFQLLSSMFEFNIYVDLKIGCSTFQIHNAFTLLNNTHNMVYFHTNSDSLPLNYYIHLIYSTQFHSSFSKSGVLCWMRMVCI